jgi:hypothetical protein
MIVLPSGCVQGLVHCLSIYRCKDLGYFLHFLGAASSMRQRLPFAPSTLLSGALNRIGLNGRWTRRHYARRTRTAKLDGIFILTLLSTTYFGEVCPCAGSWSLSN